MRDAVERGRHEEGKRFISVRSNERAPANYSTVTDFAS